MRVRFHNHTLLQSLFLSIMVCFSILAQQSVSAGVLNIPVKRAIATQPITTLEIMAIMKELFNGRVLFIKKFSSYSNPDCHYVKILEDKGEFQMIKIGCFTHKIAQSKL